MQNVGTRLNRGKIIPRNVDELFTKAVTMLGRTQDYYRVVWGKIQYKEMQVRLSTTSTIAVHSPLQPSYSHPSNVFELISNPSSACVYKINQPPQIINIGSLFRR